MLMMHMHPPTSVRVVSHVPVIDGRETSYDEFRDKFMIPNLPVLISGLTHQWRASQDWVSECGEPNLDYFYIHFGNSKVQVADCSIRDFTDQKRIDMTVAEFIHYWNDHNASLHKGDRTRSLLYLKDWHFVKDYPDYCPYTTPTFFMDDWLNFYLEHYQLHLSEDETSKETCFSDYRFVYMGPKGTWTPLHADVFRSYSWSANVCGRKIWHLLPPSETEFIFDIHGKKTVYDIYGEVSLKEFPKFQQAGWLECNQERGEVLFVPSGWYHQVTNLEDTISINHNWFNGYNLNWVWKLLLDDADDARESIEDIRLIADNFEELCERNLAANSGMNLFDFFVFLRRMISFFCSFMTHKDSDNESNGAGVENESARTYLCQNLLSEVLFNIKSIGHVADSLESRVYQVYLPRSEEPKKPEKKELSIIFGSETDQFSKLALKRSEYCMFLFEVMRRCVDHRIHGEGAGCYCAYPTNTRGSGTMCMAVSHECNRMAVFENLRNQAGIKANSPEQLAHTIRKVLDHIVN